MHIPNDLWATPFWTSCVSRSAHPRTASIHAEGGVHHYCYYASADGGMVSERSISWSVIGWPFDNKQALLIGEFPSCLRSWHLAGQDFTKAQRSLPCTIGSPSPYKKGPYIGSFGSSPYLHILLSLISPVHLHLWRVSCLSPSCYPE